jgi:hypothetical protein
VGVWLMHAVHGNEISSSDAALGEAWYLLAARGDARAERILREALVIIDPLERYDPSAPTGRTATPPTSRRPSAPSRVRRSRPHHRSIDPSRSSRG